MITTLQIQQRLAELGFDPGPLDGVRGRRTIKAIRAFQAASGLAVDGIVGPTTRAKLFAEAGGGLPASALSPDLPWFEEARRLLGVREDLRKNRSNPVIMDWADELDVWYPGDEIPWCGLFAAHCIASTLPEEELPSNPLGARNWRNFGRACEPTLGCVLVFWRTHPTKSFNGHVGFYAGEDEANFFVLAGNQGDAVTIARIAKSRLLAARFPATAPFGERSTPKLTLESARDILPSTNEA